MRSLIKILVLSAGAIGATTAYSSEGTHSKKDATAATQEAPKKEAKEEHIDEGGEGEGGGSVGPDKGIIEADEAKGFKLSPEALKNFEIKTVKLKGDGPWQITPKAVVHSGEEVNLFRLRNGYFKSIDFQVSRKSPESLTVDSDDIREGDELVVSGLGFLKISELAAFGGVAHGHSH